MQQPDIRNQTTSQYFPDNHNFIGETCSNPSIAYVGEREREREREQRFSEREKKRE